MIPLREDDWGWVNGDDHRGGRLDDIGELTHPHQEKLSLQDLSPRRRRGNGTPTEDDGVGRW
jgi:hypothetical protein